MRPESFASVYSLALADFLKSPQILQVETDDYRGLAGARLRVQAHKPYGLTAVQVAVQDAGGQVLEQGEARPMGADWWKYEITREHPAGSGQQLRITAQDRPGNEATLVVDLE